MRRSTRQSSKPVILDLKKTDYGYELIEERVIPIPSMIKNVIPRPEKPIIHSKSLVSKTGEKGLDTPPTSNYNPRNDPLMRSQTSVKPPVGGSKITFQNGMPFPERSPVGRPPADTIKREINSFSNLSMPPIRMGGQMPDTHSGDPYISHQFGQSSVPGMGSESMYSKPPPKFQKKFPVAIPSCSYWFDMDKIHLIEKDNNPEFFQGRPAKTPQAYKRCRNYMINLYRKDPANYLTPTTCRKIIGGDACTLMRIHAFLEHWGLINFYIEPNNYPVKSIFLNRMNYTEDMVPSSQNDALLDSFDPVNQKDNDNTKLFSKVKNLNSNARPLCDYCGIICGYTWYQQKSAEQKPPVIPGPEGNGVQEAPQTQETATKTATDGKKLVFCINCFAEGNFPKLYTANDFFKIDPFNQQDPTGFVSSSVRVWSNEETLRLLDLIQKFGENWGEIQKSLPHRTKEEIISHYMRIPTSHLTSINIVDMGEFKGHENLGDQIPTVFGDFTNPILKDVAIFRSLLAKFRDQKKEKQRLAEEALKAQKLKETKTEEEVTKISEGVKEGGEGNMAVEEEAKQNEDEVKVENSDQPQTMNIEPEKEKEPQDQIQDNKDNGKMVEEVIIQEPAKPEPEKTPEQKIREIADRAVGLQITKLSAKLDYLGEFENFLIRERTQQDMIQQSLIAEKIEVAKKRVAILRQNEPPKIQSTSMPHYEPKESAYYGFPAHGSFNDDHLDFTEGGF